MKYKLIFLDTETTGNTQDDYICQVAYKLGDEIACELFKPEKKIPPEASAVSHITNKMVADKPAFKNSDFYNKLKTLLDDENSILVAHNALFDIGMLKKEGIDVHSFIDTMRVTRFLDNDAIIPRYNLQYLRYYLEIEIIAQAHDAKGDVMVLEELHKRLFDKIKTESKDDDEAIEKLIDISSRPSLLRTIPFGKHKGKKIEEVVKADRSYLEWLYNQKISEEIPDEDWVYTLKHYLGIEQ